MRGLILIFLIFSFSNCHSDTIADLNFEEYEISIVCELPDVAHESSGIVFFDGLLWTINDSGNKPVLYGIDTVGGELKREVLIKGADNYDWEALTQDADYIYIADNGNNAGVRPDYKVFQISKDSLKLQNLQEVWPTKSFTYKFKDEDLDEIDLNANTIDSEAILVQGDTLYVYSKEWFSGFTNVFRMPRESGEFIGNLGGRVALGYALTAACFTSENTIAFLGYRDYHSYLTIVKCNPNLLGDVEEIISIELEDLQGYQTEAITYEQGQLFISCENLSIKQTLFRLDFR